MGGGKVSQSRDQSNQIIADQRAQAADLQQKSNAAIARGQAYQEPLVKFLQGIVGGNSTTTNQAMAPVLGQIAQRSQQAKEAIHNQLPAGAARDYALAGLERDKGAQVAGATNQTFLNAFPQLAQIGQGETNSGLQETGASISSRGNAGTGSANVLQSDTQQQANKMNAITSLASTAGSIATGGLTGLIPKGGGGAVQGRAPALAGPAPQWTPTPMPAYNFPSAWTALPMQGTTAAGTPPLLPGYMGSH